MQEIFIVKSPRFIYELWQKRVKNGITYLVTNDRRDAISLMNILNRWATFLKNKII